MWRTGEAPVPWSVPKGGGGVGVLVPEVGAEVKEEAPLLPPGAPPTEGTSATGNGATGKNALTPTLSKKRPPRK